MKTLTPENIFLDFLNPELRGVFGVNEYYKHNLHNFIFFKQLINLSIFLTKDYCILPPAFIFEDPMSFKLIKDSTDFITNGYIFIPLKLGESFSSKLNKILEEYKNVKSNYNNLNNPKALDKVVNYFDKLNLHRIEKQSDTGLLIASRFEDRLDSKNIYWENVLKSYDLKSIDHIDKLLKIPSFLMENGLAVTHGDIYNLTNQKNISSVDIHKLVHYEYGNVYMDEYNCIAFYNLFGVGKFSPTHRTDNLGYDFQISKSFLETLNIFKELTELPPSELLSIRRYYSEYSEFIGNYFLLMSNCKSKCAVEVNLAKIISRNDDLKKVVNLKIKKLGVNYIIDVLGLFNLAIKNYSQPKNIKITGKSKMKKILIFVALKEEEDILKEALSLNHNDQGGYDGQFNNTSFTVISPRKLGRVSAALEMLDFLSKNKNNLPDMVLVAGIAGGFNKNGINKGDILIPSVIYDISNTKKERKITDNESYEMYRPDPFRVNQKLIDYLNSPKFDKDKWWLSSGKKESRRTTDINVNISYKPLSCCDSVVKDEEWIDIVLSKVSHELTGVEMESGGVCMAVEKFQSIPISVIRGVSDLSNPYKADDDWRGKAMWTVCSLIKEIDFSFL